MSLIIFRCCSCRETRDRWRSKRNKSRVGTVNISVETATVTTVKAEPGRGSNVREFRKFENWSISERLVIYLAFADTFVGLAHILDHAYILFAKRSPPDPVCVTFAFLLQQFIISQWIVVLFTAVRASSLVVFGKKLSPGKRDWVLIVCAIGLPMIVGLVGVAFGILGQNGVWLV